ncbi:MAG: ABC transporter ATP-binding protein [Cyanobacteria bacterium]|nr:ABC transporter ATP-binding protein [Cyanobacteria bacterium CG_2015-16_32_12]NCO77319.1 ABC transporter ATP-binding protein [Cyanobacteria bacterium CG_2015-22_32_23]NCQ05482.1 ABC transporter ATP-binding protein [Cyanobacteria bacterium CG_2015-09_32_10]NCQ42201.1 ABC transporter ATP-binding protein [Cyanobacteria bacterium CG_2015-04_32_10]NCS84166.1 ABC transporter ATP-binding protein [Cyanobacteria bacterium CG_2015-02_32_10]
MTKSVILQVKGVSKQFTTSQILAVNEVSFDLKQGELLGLLGPSGCGKTTLLRIIAGFEKPSQGTVELEKEIVAGEGHWLEPEKRNTGMVFQDYALFPHLNVADNIAFGLKTKKPRPNNQQIKDRVAEVLQLVGLSGFEKRYTHELSGGQQQRIALARALAPQPKLILLDEPLSNLDVQVRERLRHEVRTILKSTNTSAIFVTHDQEEAMAIADKIGVMERGKLAQIGTPEEIYSYPQCKFVAEFVTQANFLQATKKDSLWCTELGQWCIDTPVNVREGELMFRQEDVILEADEEGVTIIQEREFLGREYRYCLQTNSGKRLHARTDIKTQLPVGAKVRLDILPQTAQIFPLY